MFWYVENYLYHNEDYREAIQQLACPTTFFIGRNSTLYSETGQTLIAHSVEHAKAIYFERSGHTPLLTEPKSLGMKSLHSYPNSSMLLKNKGIYLQIPFKAHK